MRFIQPDSRFARLSPTRLDCQPSDRGTTSRCITFCATMCRVVGRVGRRLHNEMLIVLLRMKWTTDGRQMTSVSEMIITLTTKWYLAHHFRSNYHISHKAIEINCSPGSLLPTFRWTCLSKRYLNSLRFWMMWLWKLCNMM